MDCHLLHWHSFQNHSTFDIIYLSTFSLPLDTNRLHIIVHYPIHRGLKLDGAIGQGEICNSLISEKFSKSFLFHIGKNK